MAAGRRSRDRYGRPLPPGRADELVRGPEPATIDEAVERAAVLFDSGRFFEAHELFEWVWKARDTASQDRDFWKGAAQVAVGCCQVQRGNARGAVAVLRRAARNLAGAASRRRIDGAELTRIALDLAARVESGGTAAVRAFPRLPRH